MFWQWTVRAVSPAARASAIVFVGSKRGIGQASLDLCGLRALFTPNTRFMDGFIDVGRCERRNEATHGAGFEREICRTNFSFVSLSGWLTPTFVISNLRALTK